MKGMKGRGGGREGEREGGEEREGGNKGEGGRKVREVGR